MTRIEVGVLSTGIAIVVVLGVWTVRGGRGREAFDATSAPTADSSGRYPEAGVSYRQPPVVVPLDPGELGGDTVSEAFHAFMHRCGGCHRAPSPSAHRAEEWPPVVRRMELHIRQAGLMPLTEPTGEEIQAFLARHAATTRSGPSPK